MHQHMKVQGHVTVFLGCQGEVHQGKKELVQKHLGIPTKSPVSFLSLPKRLVVTRADRNWLSESQQVLETGNVWPVLPIGHLCYWLGASLNHPKCKAAAGGRGKSAVRCFKLSRLQCSGETWPFLAVDEKGNTPSRENHGTTGGLDQYRLTSGSP